MINYKVTKDQIIEAVLTEPLRATKFFHSSSGKDDGVCEVCAVGAVLRSIKPNQFHAGDGWDATNAASHADDLPFAYDRGNFLSILSCEFESYVKTNSLEGSEPEVREYLLHVIEAFCPKIVTFTLED